MNKVQLKLTLFVFLVFLSSTIIAQPPPPPDPDPVPIQGIIALIIGGLFYGIHKLRKRD